MTNKTNRNKCKRIVYDCTFRLLTEKERIEKNIKSKGIGIWICINCGRIKHSM